jgi:hypothetical protein
LRGRLADRPRWVVFVELVHVRRLVVELFVVRQLVFELVFEQFVLHLVFVQQLVVVQLVVVLLLVVVVLVVVRRLVLEQLLGRRRRRQLQLLGLRVVVGVPALTISGPGRAV